ncbi:MAG: SDR family NAD(P)-dependent oxidoreductase, partial [Phenylobacterium sp.]|nr:SDR family NAD(P)-dependent oxidoreductase [Phenylobacterium sp.]
MADIRFDGKVAIVTGAGGGLGRQHALELARRGAKVVVNDLGGSVDGSGGSSSAADAVVDEIKAAGGEAISNGSSVTDDAGVALMIKQAMDQWGRIDILVANAGINHRAPITEFAVADFQRVMNTNLTSVWVLCRAAAKVMVPRRQGRIIMTGSISAINARPTVSAYVASKG